MYCMNSKLSCSFPFTRLLTSTCYKPKMNKSWRCNSESYLVDSKFTHHFLKKEFRALCQITMRVVKYLQNGEVLDEFVFGLCAEVDFVKRDLSGMKSVHELTLGSSGCLFDTVASNRTENRDVLFLLTRRRRCAVSGSAKEYRSTFV